MHERSLVSMLLRQVDAIRLEHGGDLVTEVRVEIGALAGVEPVLLATAFEQMAPHSSASGAALILDEVDVLAACLTCNDEFTVTDFVFRCPQCDGNVRVLRGDELLLTNVSLSGENTLPEARS